MTAREIPTIDLSDANAQDQILQAYSTVGFAYVAGHGIDDDLVSAVFDASRRFHSLPLGVKMQVEVDALHRGYIPIASSTDRGSELGRAARPNQSESFMMMREGADDPLVYLEGPNQWPTLEGFRPAVEAYDTALSVLAASIVELLADALGDDGTMRSAFDTPTTWLRLLRYPPRPAGAPADEFGSAPHTDFGAITLLALDGVGGLEVRDPDGAWIDVPPQPGTFVMNTGEMVRRWSNGRLRATPHRVVNPSGRERYSVPYFFDPHMTTAVRPLDIAGNTVGPDVARFAPVRFDQYVRKQLESGYDRHGRRND